MRDQPTPYLSYIGLVIWLITLAIHLTFSYSQSFEVGLRIILSVFNAALLIYTLLWSIMAIIELRKLLLLRKRANTHLATKRITEEIHRSTARRLTFCFTVNGIYLFLVLGQLIYVLYQWEELMI